MRYITTILICIAAMGSLAAAETISEVFQEHFQITLPEGYHVSYAGGKPGEKQFSLIHKSKHLISLFVYYDGLDPRKWSTYFDEGKDVFLYHKDQIFVYARLPTDMNDETRSAVKAILASIQTTSSNNRVETTGVPPSPHP